MAENMFQGEMDPELAALLGTDQSAAGNEPPPDFSSIFEEEGGDSAGGGEQEGSGVDLTSATFPKVEKFFEDTPHNNFDNPNYYKTALGNEGDIAQRVHTILTKYINTKDPKDRSVFRQQFIPAFWEYLRGVAAKAPGGLVEAKKFLLRFGIMHPSLLNAETKTYFAKIIVDNKFDQPIFYLDEWFKGIGTGKVRPSTTDEVHVAKSNTNVRMQQLLEKATGKLDGAKTLLMAKDQERLSMEKNLKEQFNSAFEHYPAEGFREVNSCYSEAQRRMFGSIQEMMKNLLKVDNELNMYFKEYYQATTDVRGLQNKVEAEGGAVAVDVQAVSAEFDTVRQMAKMTIGRQGNHFPLLTSEYFHCDPKGVGFRENIITMLAHIESIDSEAFCRTYRNRLNRIVPYVILLPTYGDTGVCWEPFDKHNRATSRGRIAIPMYPKSLYLAVLTAVGDLRWQVAKEKASFYWMEEGLTGNYYQWFNAQKLKGDVKEYFIQDYILWMTKEADAIQKLDKELRGIFWRYMPFSKAIKEKLKTRSYVYQELFQRDVNRTLSDGY